MATLIPTSLIISLSCHRFPSSFSATKIRYPVGVSSWIHTSCGRRHGHGFVGSLQAAILGKAEGSFDPELRSVLELATDSELYELERILFGPSSKSEESPVDAELKPYSYFSPLLKSFTNTAENNYVVLGEDYEERQYFTELLESRFLFLAADARSTLRGWKPTYRDVLLDVRRKLRVPCSSKLSTEDLEVEIFLHLLQEYSSHESGTVSCSLESSKISRSHGSLELGLSQWKVQGLAALKVGAAELQSTFLKGGGVLTMAKIFQLFARGLSGKMLLEAANYQIKHELVKKGGRMAALNLESRAALLAARQGFAGAASRYLGLRSMMTLLGPMLWGTFLADVVIQMLGTDYARILRAIYAFAQASQVNKVNDVSRFRAILAFKWLDETSKNILYYIKDFM